MPVAWAIGAGVGLATLAGFRVFSPAAVYIFMAQVGWVWGFGIPGPLKESRIIIALAVLLVLAVLEAILTNTGMEQWMRLPRPPLAALSGALLFWAALAGQAGDWRYLGIPAGLLLALLSNYVYRGIKLVGEGRDPGPALDFLVLLLSALMMGLPPAGYALGLAIVWLGLRVRRLKRMKYKGLRVLA